MVSRADEEVPETSTASTARNGSNNLGMISLKLDDSNFLLWTQQIVPAIKGASLFRYVDNTDSAPARFRTPTEAQNNEVNPAFLAWEEQDQALLSWIINTLSIPMQRRVVGCKTSKHVWSRIHEHFAAQSKARIQFLQSEFYSMKKGMESVTDYILKLKTISDSLHSVGIEIGDQQFIFKILEGLPDDYKVFTTAATMRLDTLTVSDLEALLLIEEAKIEKSFNTLSANLPTVNLTQTNAPANHANHSENNTGPSDTFVNYTNFDQGGRGGGRSGFRGRGRGRGRATLSCQLCLRSGHTVFTCWHRFDPDYQPSYAFIKGIMNPPPNSNKINLDKVMFN